jgi:hypothetical protein
MDARTRLGVTSPVFLLTKSMFKEICNSPEDALLV